MKRILRIGSRESRLAVAQAQQVMAQLQANFPDYELELVTMKTTGDRILDRSLDRIGGKGLFVKELDQALLDNRIDLAVHSLKDMPMEESEELPILAFSERADPRDALVLSTAPDARPFWETIGSSSARRKLQLLTQFPQGTVVGVRGNVLTRLEKLEQGTFTSLILAAAGLERLGLSARIARKFSTKEILPAAGQGILAIQGRRGECDSWITQLDCPESRAAALAERQFVRVLDGGCSSPIAAYAQLHRQELCLTGLYAEPGNSYWTHTLCGDRAHPERLGETLANCIRKEGTPCPIPMEKSGL